MLMLKYTYKTHITGVMRGGIRHIVRICLTFLHFYDSLNTESLNANTLTINKVQ